MTRQIHEDAGKAPTKQKHTARRIFERLRDKHGNTGGEAVVRNAVRECSISRRQVVLPLSHPSGEAQADFGEATMRIAGKETKAAIFVMALPYSGAMFVQAFPKECKETMASAKGLTKQPHLLPNSAAGCSSFSLWPARQGDASRRRNAAACRLLPRTGSPLHDLAAVRSSPSLRRTSDARPRPQADACAMALKPRGSRQRPAGRKPILLPTNFTEHPPFSTAPRRRFQPPSTRRSSKEPWRNILATSPRSSPTTGHSTSPRTLNHSSAWQALRHLRTSPAYPQSNGKLERWHGTLKSEELRYRNPRNVEDARGVVGNFVTHYDAVRLHSALGYVTPYDKLAGRDTEIFASRDSNLQAARAKRLGAK